LRKRKPILALKVAPLQKAAAKNSSY